MRLSDGRQIPPTLTMTFLQVTLCSTCTWLLNPLISGSQVLGIALTSCCSYHLIEHFHVWGGG